MMAQDSSDPTGVSGGTDKEHQSRNAVARARLRKSHAAITMALAGATWGEIALALGYPTARQARVSVEKALEKELVSSDDREALRRLAGARLDRLLRTVWAKATDPDHPEQLAAQREARAHIAQHSKLYGLDAPTEVIFHNPTLTEIEQWVGQVAAMRSSVTVVEADVIDVEEDQRALPAGA